MDGDLKQAKQIVEEAVRHVTIPKQDVRDLIPTSLRLRRSGGRLEEDYEAVVESWEAHDA